MVTPLVAPQVFSKLWKTSPIPPAGPATVNAFSGEGVTPGETVAVGVLPPHAAMKITSAAMRGSQREGVDPLDRFGLAMWLTETVLLSYGWKTPAGTPPARAELRYLNCKS